jgi:hypothetical protein
MITLTYKNNNRYLLKIGEDKYHLSEKEVIKLNKQSEKLLKEGVIRNVRNKQ